MMTPRDDYRRMSDELLDLHLRAMSAAGKSEETIASRRVVLRMLHARLPFGLAYAATEQIEAWLADIRARGRSRWTLSNYAYHVRSFFQWAGKAGFLDGDPTATMERPRQPVAIPKPVTEAELELALTLSDPFRTACVLAAFAGLRRAEITQCRREDITPEALRIPHGKGDKQGVVPTHPYLWEQVKGRPPGHLIVDHNGRPVTAHWLSQQMRVAFDVIGLPDVHLHRLRHRYGTMIQATTGNLRVTQECMRHASVTSTQGYTLVTQAQRTAAIAALPVPGAAPAS